MSKFKGTKGRWKVCDKHKTILDEFDYGIAQMHGVLNEDEWDANAKLISLAPEMLEMIKRCEMWISNCNQHANIIKDLNELIKKATE